MLLLRVCGEPYFLYLNNLICACILHFIEYITLISASVPRDSRNNTLCRDMDFNFDGDFGKLSSFKVDMSDLDFSPKKTGKSKERSGEESVSRNHQGKKDNFTFSFDFNE